MTGVALLEEARARGVAVYRVGDRLRWLSSAPIPPDLLTRLSEHKSELLRVAPDYDAISPALTATVSTAKDAAAIEWYAMLNGDAIIEEIVGLERRCEDLARFGADATLYRAAVVALVARLKQIRAWYGAANPDEPTPKVVPRAPRQLTLDANRQIRGQVLLDDGTEITDAGKFIAQTLTAIDYVLQHPPRSYPGDAALIPRLHPAARTGRRRGSRGACLVKPRVPRKAAVPHRRTAAAVAAERHGRTADHEHDLEAARDDGRGTHGGDRGRHQDHLHRRMSIRDLRGALQHVHQVLVGDPTMSAARPRLEVEVQLAAEDGAQ